MECSICYTDQKMCKLSCNHLFCKSCIKTWYLAGTNGVGDSTCPMCRTSLEFKGSEFVKLMWSIQNINYNTCLLLWKYTYLHEYILNYFLMLDKESKTIKELYKKVIHGYQYYIRRVLVFVNDVYLYSYSYIIIYNINYYFTKYPPKTPQVITWI